MRNGFLSDYFFERNSGGHSNGIAGGKRRWTEDPYFILVIRVVVAVVFIYASVQKIGRPLLFADEIKMYGIITGGPFLYLMSIALPWIELF